MLQQFRQLNEREQLMVAVLAALIAAIAVFVLVVNPVLTMRDNAVADYARARRLAAMTEGLEAGAAETPDGRALRLVATELADRNGLVYTRINQAENGAIQIDLANAPYPAFYTWLEALDKEEDVVVVEAFVTAGDGAGTLDARVSLARVE